MPTPVAARTTIGSISDLYGELMRTTVHSSDFAACQPLARRQERILQELHSPESFDHAAVLASALPSPKELVGAWMRPTKIWNSGTQWERRDSDVTLALTEEVTVEGSEFVRADLEMAVASAQLGAVFKVLERTQQSAFLPTLRVIKFLADMIHDDPSIKQQDLLDSFPGQLLAKRASKNGPFTKDKMAKKAYEILSSKDWMHIVDIRTKSYRGDRAA